MHRKSRRTRSARWIETVSIAILAMSLVLTGTLPCSADTRRTPPRQDVLDLEPAVSLAELILAVRLADVTETKIVHGGRTEQVTEQYRLEPVRVLKGLFAREALVMTGQDLGIYRFAEGSERLERGQVLLVFLGRQNGNFVNCNLNCPTLSQSIPRLSGQEDRLLDSVETLIAMSEHRDRVEQVVLLRNGLKTQHGRSAATLLLALQRRALIAAQTPGTIAEVSYHLDGDNHSQPTEQAALTLKALLEADYLVQFKQRREAAKKLALTLEDAGPNVQTRVAILNALGATGPAGSEIQSVVDLLTSDRIPSTFAERSAVLRALGEIASNSILDLARGDVGLLHRDAQFQRLATILDDMPLDAPSEVEDAVIRAMIQLNGTARGLGTSKHLKDRLVRKSEAGLSIANDIARLSGLPRSNLFTDPPQNAATNLFHEAFSRPLDVKEQLAFATAARSHADPSLVPALATLLDPRQPQIRYQAVEALIQINTEEAASALWPHLQEEIDLARKLELIAFLGRHGFKDGYSIAIEHLSQPALRDLAVEALASLDEPKTVPQLTRIWATSHDLNWNAAAIRALARLGQNDIAPKLLEIADDLSNPLADSALIALGDLGDERAVPLVQKGLTSRSDALAIASARAAAKLLSNPKIQADAIRDQLASLLSDPMASPTLRTEALNSLVTLNDPRLDPALAQAVRDSTLEHTELGARIEAELVKRKVPLKPEE